ncbi:hypothetical protein APS56_08640 [Pseudalgibacter alginicilyticus]|uniref:Uncharacterized protein n=1 Tax=Pseudalgibacter alginicilyticus TaxID=1736674 RepID=A0A0P0CQT6_9FLAO|nr:hypothetical protein [Pseudalgibacter alginicilyticus]ALJ05186.1 hypothetical protein APS56_08640 [Pseudalgibacter alginicilyticus]
MKTTVAAKRAFLDLLFIKNQVHKLLGNDEKYRKLIAFMMSNDFLESDEPLPSLKSMESSLNMKAHKLRKLITDLYNELFSYELKHGLKFNKLEIYFDLHCFEGQFGYFKCTDLAYIPRVGENMTIPFLKAKVGTDYFYVYSIRHTLENDVQRIDIRLNSGFFNQYFHFEKHKAYELGRISLGDLFRKHDLNLKDKMEL